MASNFEDRMDNLRTSAEQVSEQLRAAEVNPQWFAIIGDSPTDIVDPFDGSETREKFNRDQEAKDYDSAITTPESFRKAQAAKLQSDTLAALERDTRMRHRTRVRMLAHATAKLATHGLSDGPIKRGVLFVNRLKEQASG